MQQTIRSPEDLALVIRAVRKHVGVRQDDLAALAGLSKQFATDVERGKPTAQIGRVLHLLSQLGLTLTVQVPDDVRPMLERVRARRAQRTEPAKPARTEGA